MHPLRTSAATIFFLGMLSTDIRDMNKAEAPGRAAIPRLYTESYVEENAEAPEYAIAFGERCNGFYEDVSIVYPSIIKGYKLTAAADKEGAAKFAEGKGVDPRLVRYECGARD